jgi:nitroimidazol reductase NimA-like FMN-containing flavoprotein (pyridoxamine 5'-phosphate oxidase superfamily)
MATKQGGLELLQDPIAQEMLHAPIPARLAYVWMDGSPRVVPIAFHWDGQEIVMAGPTDAPKVKALEKNPNVAVTLDNNTMPYKVLLIRGKVSMTTVDGIVPEYALAMERYMEKKGQMLGLARCGL